MEDFTDDISLNFKVVEVVHAIDVDSQQSEVYAQAEIHGSIKIGYEELEEVEEPEVEDEQIEDEVEATP